MDLSEIDAKIAELQALRERAAEEARVQEAREQHAEATEILTNLAPNLTKLYEWGYLPPKLETALTDSTGKWNPGMFIKRPRAFQEPPDSTPEPVAKTRRSRGRAKEDPTDPSPDPQTE